MINKTSFGDSIMKTWKQQNSLRQFSFDRCGLKRINSGRGLFFALALWLLTFPATVAAQGWYWGSPVTPGYDRSSVVEVSGAVLQVDVYQRGGGSTLRIESGGEFFTVTLGPGWYLRRQGADIRVGDKLTVKGSKMKSREGKIYLIAARIKNMRTDHVLELRDENGLPLWSSKRRSDREGR
jgi:hypothetical protein